MPYYPLEAFCFVEYPTELTYEELMAYEAELVPALETGLASLGAVHVDVFPDGDTLRVHCAFSDVSEADFDVFARDLAEPMRLCTQAKILLLRKDLSTLRLACLRNGDMHIQSMPLG